MKRKIPLLDLTRIEPALEAELLAAFERVLRSGHYILGPEVESFEAACAAYVGSEHAIGVSSGTDALLMALMACGVSARDEVICPTYTFFATAGCIWRTGARPVFVDIDLETFNCRVDQVAECITPRTKAIVPVHLFGQVVDVRAALAGTRPIAIIEDAAQALGARLDGRSAGQLGHVACFSFFPSKNLGGFGDSGLVTTNDAALAERMRLLRAHGAKPKYHHHVVGGNFRIDALQAALLHPKLKRLDDWTARRQANAARYSALLKDAGIGGPNQGQVGQDLAPILFPVARSERHVYNQYNIRVTGGRRDALREHLSQHGVGTEIYYPVPMHMQKCFSDLGYREGAFPMAETASRESLALPLFPQLAPDETEYVVQRIAEFYRG